MAAYSSTVACPVGGVPGTVALAMVRHSNHTSEHCNMQSCDSLGVCDGCTAVEGSGTVGWGVPPLPPSLRFITMAAV